MVSAGARQSAHGPRDPGAADRAQTAGAKLRDLEGSLRGLLRGFGLKVGAVSKGKFEARIREPVAGQAGLERRGATRARSAAGGEQEAEHLSLATAIRSVAAKIGEQRRDAAAVGAPAERDASRQGSANADERERIKALERAAREFRQAYEILREASAYFAQAELDRPSKP